MKHSMWSLQPAGVVPTRPGDGRVVAIHLPRSRGVRTLLVMSLLLGTVLVGGLRPAGASGGPTFVASTHDATSADTTSIALARPVKVSKGEILVAVVYVRSSPDVSAPQGWRTVREDAHAHVYYKIADSSEPSTYTWRFSSAHAAVGGIAAYAGVDTAQPLLASSGQANDASTDIVAPGVNDAAGSVVVGFFGISRATSITPPSGYLERVDTTATTDGKGLSFEMADHPVSKSGASGNAVAVAGESGGNVGELIALRAAATSDPSAPYRAFPASSYWNTPLPADAPIDPNSANYVSYMKSTTTSGNFIGVGGTDNSGLWGNAVYWAAATDPLYDVKSTVYPLPSQFSSLRIPKGARSSADSDAEIVVFDQPDGYVASLWQAQYNATSDTWTAGGGAVYYLDSNGLVGALRQSDDSRNIGHRGMPPSSMTIRYDEVMAGAIDHVLRLSIPKPSSKYVFPYIGSDGSSSSTSAPPEGARLRLKPSIDLSAMNLSPSEYALAKAAQDYGFVIGDGSGGPVTVSTENTIVEGRGWLWNGVLTFNSLSEFPLDDYVFVQNGYGG